MKPRPKTYIYKTASTHEAQGALLTRGWKDYKSQRIKEFAVGLWLLLMSEATLITSHQMDYLNMNLTRTIFSMLKWTEESLQGLKHN